MKFTEIERKFLLESPLPLRSWQPATRLRQGYLKVSPEEEIRIRQEGRRKTLTIKSGTGIQRIEWEVRLRSADFAKLWAETSSRRIEKMRRRVHLGDLTWELDEYRDRHEGLRILELEFSSLEEARAFNPALFGGIGPELTWDPRYKNAFLSGENDGVLHRLPLEPGNPELMIGVIPFIREGDDFNLVAITTRKGDRWILPKGQTERDLTWEAVALLEAEEEAGLHGKLVGHPLLLPYTKDTRVANLLVYPMEVATLDSRWLEQDVRQRKTFSSHEASALEDNFLLSTASRVIQTLYCQ